MSTSPQQTGPFHSSVVSGRVLHRDGFPAAGVPVAAFARRLRSQTSLGETTTGSDGRYRLEYQRHDGPTDLVVRATAMNGAHVESVRYDPGSEETVDLTVSAGASEYERLLADISPLLDGEELHGLFEDDTRRDLTYLARATGRDATQVGYLALANRHAAATGLFAGAFYGLLRQGFPADLSVLARHSVADLRLGLLSAVDAGIIAELDPAAVRDFTETLRAREAAAFLSPENDGASPVAEVFSIAIADQTIRERIYHAYLDRDGDAARFWTTLVEDEKAAPYVERLRLALHLSSLTGHNPALVRTLLGQFDGGELTHPRDMAGLTSAEWRGLAEDHGVPETFRATITAEQGLSTDDLTSRYGDLVESLVARAYPTAHVAHALARESGDSPAADFLARNPEFNLFTAPVNSSTVPEGAVAAELAPIQRLVKLTPRFDEVKVLRDKGFNSSYSIAKAGSDRFTEALSDSLGPERAAAVHARAARVNGSSVNLIADLRTAGQFSAPWLPGVSVSDAVMAQIPNWEDLFGSPDYCACSECRSVHSQAAYLVDLLLFLRDIGYWGDPEPQGGEGSVANELYRRRPDIWDVQLTCDNTNLQLPYVDLVNELLEDAVSPTTPIPATQRQTSGDPAQIRVQPQHINNGAYDVLRSAVYRWSLPFDLWGELTRVSLDHLGVRRDQLIATLQPALATSTAVAVEHIGLPSVAGHIIAGEPINPSRSLVELYGRSATTPPEKLVDDLINVRRMLDAAQMRYADLVAVLDTRFINPREAIQIVGTDPDHPCDTNLLYLQGLDLATLERLHRFVRLQRALGWSSIELDRVLLASNNGDRLDATALRCVVAAQRLANRLGLDTEQVLCFYGPLSTYQYKTTAEPPLYDRLFLDPSVVTLEPGQANPFELNGARSELKIIGDLRTPLVATALLAVLQVTDTELAELVSGPRSVTPNRLLNLANLSALYRTVVLARALDMPIAELLRLIELYGGGGPLPGAPGRVD